MNRIRCLLLMVLLAGSAAACMDDRSQQAQAIDRQIKAMPGVSDTEITRYISDIVQGQSFDYRVGLSSDATPEQAADVTRTFVEQTGRQGLAEHYIALSLGYRGSGASFELGFDAPLTAADAAEDTAAWVRRAGAPGVAATGLRWSRSYPPARRVVVTLRSQATDAQAVELAREFFDGHHPDLDQTFALSYSAAGSPTPRAGESAASFTFGPADNKPDPDFDAVAAGVRVWLPVARSTIVELVDLTEPAPQGTGDRAVAITLVAGTSAADSAALQHSDPGLADATWTMKLPVGDRDRTHDYTSAPNPPNDADWARWTQISGVVGQYYDANATTRGGADQASTEIAIEIDKSADSDAAVPRVARGVAALLPGFGHPATMVLSGPDGPIEITAGGCYRHRSDHQRLELEIELSERYETC